VGEPLSGTPYTFDGYWQDPAKTAEAFRGDWRAARPAQAAARQPADG
jgi:fatty-acyl-CoA synthase